MRFYSILSPDAVSGASGVMKRFIYSSLQQIADSQGVLWCDGARLPEVMRLLPTWALAKRHESVHAVW